MDHGMLGAPVPGCGPARDVSGGQRHGRVSLGKQPTLSLLQLRQKRLDRRRWFGRGSQLMGLNEDDVHLCMPRQMTTLCMLGETMLDTTMALGYLRWTMSV